MAMTEVQSEGEHTDEKEADNSSHDSDQVSESCDDVSADEELGTMATSF